MVPKNEAETALRQGLTPSTLLYEKTTTTIFVLILQLRGIAARLASACANCCIGFILHLVWEK
ncbi:hypothetical protein CWE13_11325 [Aliidiomarina shirensis]|uniref:Uncharacterized protein n=1 Tax=Aliidiomarina shirensis TaxID=1048642 RepID=A0A432WNZ7_9GAMM|nr:hypothetical protein CWE13_11325 [Aliidiomarina shirensis]